MKALTVPSIFSVIDKVTAPVRAMEKSTSAFAARTEREFRKIGNTATDVAKKTALIGAAILVPLGLAANAASNFEAKMANVSTLIDTTKENMGAMSNAVLDMSTRIPVALDDLASGLYDVRSAGIAAEKSLNTLEISAKLSVAGLSQVSEATNIMTSAINAFKSEGLTSEQIADKLFKTVKAGKTNIEQMSQAFGATAPIVQAAGVTLDEFLASQAAITQAGTPVSQAQQQIRAAVISLQKPTAEMEKIFNRLGVAGGEELIKKTGGLVPAMQAIEKEGKKMGVNMAKAWSSVEASAAKTALAGSANMAYVETLKDMRTGANALDEAFRKQQEANKNQAILAKNNINALVITLGTGLLPIINKLAKIVTPIIRAFGNWIRENREFTKVILVVAAGLGGLALAVSGVSSVIAIFTKIAAIATRAQWLWNLAMTANPVGLVIAAVVGLIAVVAIAIAKWDEWGAALVVVLGPLGLILALVQSFRKHWDNIVNAFKTGGILAGLKAIGVALVDAILYPLQRILQLAAKIPGMGIAGKFASDIESFRARIGAIQGEETEGSGATKTQAVNPEASRQEAMVQRLEKNTNKNMTVDFKNVPLGTKITGGDKDILGPVKPSLGSTATGVW